MNRMYSSCAAGLEGVAAKLAARGVAGFRLEKLLGGAILYRADEEKPKLPVFQNTYAVIASYAGGASPERAASRALSDRPALKLADDLIGRYGYRTFRVMFSDQNKLVSANPSIRAGIERAIRTAKPDRVTPETEILFLRRSEGMTLFLLRLTKRDGTEKTLAKGELSPAVAACMAEMCDPKPDGVFWDPFAGNGSIGEARLKLSPIKALLLSDTDPEMLNRMKSRRGLNAGATRVFLSDALSACETVPDKSVTELATDPPWGMFAPLPLPAPEFYGRMLREFCRVLAPGGRLCVLTADKEAFEEATAAFTDALAFDRRVDLLVNGKKAALYAATAR